VGGVRVVRPIWAAESKEQQSEYLKLKNDFQRSKNLNYWDKKGNTINNCAIFKVYNFR
jgi:hypothetical protein